MKTIRIKFDSVTGDMQIEQGSPGGPIILGSRPWQDPYDDIPIDTKGAMVTWLRDIFEDLGEYEVEIVDWEVD